MQKNDGASVNHVVVAMSGGVDSSVAAALLVEQGYKVTGIMMRLWESERPDDDGKTLYNRSLTQAREVAQQLHIPFHEINATAEFRTKVVEYFIRSHQKGITPNPCFVCNRLIKWGLLLDTAKKLGADRLASGHYASVNRGDDGIYKLYKGKDILKDQSYVLAGLNQFQLAQVMFPLGKLTKTETRRIAHRYGFLIRDQEESQDLCFLEGRNQEEFLMKYAPELFYDGDICTVDGRVVGKHSGLANYTIGQRKGIKLSHSEPYFVLKKEWESNSIIVGTRSQLGTSRVTISEVNWTSGKEPVLPAKYQVKIRYKSALINTFITQLHDSEYDIIFKDIVRDPTPGQYAVIYDGESVVGSGVITDTHYGDEK